LKFEIKEDIPFLKTMMVVKRYFTDFVTNEEKPKCGRNFPTKWGNSSRPDFFFYIIEKMAEKKIYSNEK